MTFENLEKAKELNTEIVKVTEKLEELTCQRASISIGAGGRTFYYIEFNKPYMATMGTNKSPYMELAQQLMDAVIEDTKNEIKALEKQFNEL